MGHKEQQQKPCLWHNQKYAEGDLTTSPFTKTAVVDALDIFNWATLFNVMGFSIELGCYEGMHPSSVVDISYHCHLLYSYTAQRH